MMTHKHKIILLVAIVVVVVVVVALLILTSNSVSKGRVSDNSESGKSNVLSIESIHLIDSKSKVPLKLSF